MRTLLETALRVVLFAGLAGLLLWPLELLLPLRAPRFTGRAWLCDLGWLLLGALTLRLFVEPVVGWLAARLPPPGPAQSASPGRLAAALLGSELVAYAAHRAMHEVPLLWRFHALHHAPRALDWLKAFRQHPVDVAVQGVLVALPGLLLGVPLGELAALVLLRRLYTGLLHANVRVPAPLGWLAHVVATPAFHRAHHSHDPRLHDANYASTLPILDHLFGTFRGFSEEAGSAAGAGPDPARPA